jgi:hypothetical protein
MNEAETWPEWTDEDFWELGPDPDDTQWWAEQSETWDADEPTPDDVLDDLIA